MMDARCKTCNKQFHYRNTKGNKLANYSCDCGGKYEALGGSHSLSGENPVFPEKTFESTYTKGRFFYADKNKAGKYFVAKDGYYHEIENPIKAESWHDVFIREFSEQPTTSLVKISESENEFKVLRTLFTWKEFKLTRSQYPQGLIQWHFNENTWLPKSMELLLETTLNPAHQSEITANLY